MMSGMINKGFSVCFLLETITSISEQDLSNCIWQSTLGFIYAFTPVKDLDQFLGQCIFR